MHMRIVREFLCFMIEREIVCRKNCIGAERAHNMMGNIKHD